MRGFLISRSPSALKTLHQSDHSRQQIKTKAILMLDKGYSYQETAEVLLVDDMSIHCWDILYQTEGFNDFLSYHYRGSQTKLTPEQIEELDTHLQDKVYQTAKEICGYIEKQYGVIYTEKGMTSLMHKLDYSYRKPKYVPGKANVEKQQTFIADYEVLKKEKATEDRIYFMDAVHPMHNSQLAYRWMKKD